VQEFDFEVRDKGKLGVVGEPINKPTVHTLTDPELSQREVQDLVLKRVLLERQPRFSLC